jgi:tetratricopeptide (TPR) repeat protein
MRPDLSAQGPFGQSARYYTHHVPHKPEHLPELLEGLKAFPKNAALWAGIYNVYSASGQIDQAHIIAARAYRELPAHLSIIDLYAASSMELSAQARQKGDIEAAMDYAYKAEEALWAAWDIEGIEHNLIRGLERVYTQIGEHDLAYACVKASNPPFDQDAIGKLIHRKGNMSDQAMNARVGSAADLPLALE